MFRATVRREHVAAVIAERLASIDYTNFKGSLRVSDTDRHDAYFGVWRNMLNGIKGVGDKCELFSYAIVTDPFNPLITQGITNDYQDHLQRQNLTS